MLIRPTRSLSCCASWALAVSLLAAYAPVSVEAQTTRVNVSSAGAQCAEDAEPAGMSADARYVYFRSTCTTLTPDGLAGTFRRDTLTNTTTRLGDAGQVSSDGRYLLLSQGDALVRRDLVTGTELVVPTQFGHSSPLLTPNGRHVSFLSYVQSFRGITWAWLLEVFDAQTGTTCQAHVAMDGTLPDGYIGILTSASLGNAFAPVLPSVSADGRFVVFASEASNLVPNDRNRRQDVFVHDCATRQTTRVSVGAGGVEADGSSFSPVISDDGRYVVFQSEAITLTSEARGGVFVHDRQTGRTRRANTPNVWPRSFAWSSVSAHLAVSFMSQPFGPSATLWLYDYGTGDLVRADTLLSGSQPDAATSYMPTMFAFSADGRHLTFASNAPDLVSGDTNGATDVFVIDLKADTDGDTIDNLRERLYGLDPTNAADAGADLDGDGLSTLAELQAGTHPRGLVSATRYFAEGASTDLFDTRFELTNPSLTTTAHALLRFERSDGTFRTAWVAVPPRRTRHYSVDAVPDSDRTEYATVVESDIPIAVERTMFFGGAIPYGSHAETGMTARSTTWYAAEGTTVGAFDLFYLLHNPGATTATVTATFLLPSGSPVQRVYSIGPGQRFTVWADQIPGLSSTDVSAEFVVTAGSPIGVERALYLSRPGELFSAGHAASAVAAPATEWFFAEGATGPFFDLFLLVANPGTQAAEVEATYLLPDGTTRQKAYSVPARSRFTIWVDEERFAGLQALADTAVSTVLRSLNGVPIVAERAMWWPSPAGVWQEAHVATGATATGSRWLVSGGEATPSPVNASTYLLVANRSSYAATVRVTLLLEPRFPWSPPNTVAEFTVPPTSRLNVDVGAAFPSLVGALSNRTEVFGALVEGLGATPPELVVERATYRDAGGVRWAVGAATLATRLP